MKNIKEIFQKKIILSTQQRNEKQNKIKELIIKNTIKEEKNGIK